MLELERRQLDDLVLAGEDASEARLEVAPAHRAQEADTAEVDPDHGDPGPEEARQHAQHRPAAEHDGDVRGGGLVGREERVLLRLLRGIEGSTPYSCATACNRAMPAPIWPVLPCVTTAARVIALGGTDGLVDPAVDVIRVRCARSVHEVDEELPVPLRAGQPRVYDARRHGTPFPCRADHALDYPPLHLGSRTTPFPTSERLASNCGLTRTSASQPGRASASTGGSAFVTLMNETSQVTRSGTNGSS